MESGEHVDDVTSWEKLIGVQISHSYKDFFAKQIQSYTFFFKIKGSHQDCMQYSSKYQC